jgi:hypothetical protein
LLTWTSPYVFNKIIFHLISWQQLCAVSFQIYGEIEHLDERLTLLKWKTRVNIIGEFQISTVSWNLFILHVRCLFGKFSTTLEFNGQENNHRRSQQEGEEQTIRNFIESLLIFFHIVIERVRKYEICWRRRLLCAQ